MPLLSRDSDGRRQMLDWVRELSDKEFAEFFYDAVAERNTSDQPEWRGHFILADAESVDNGPWGIDFVALPVEAEQSGWTDDAPICQSGTCKACGSEVRSWSKRAECPVCGEAVHCS